MLRKRHRGQRDLPCREPELVYSTTLHEWVVRFPNLDNPATTELRNDARLLNRTTNGRYT